MNTAEEKLKIKTQKDLEIVGVLNRVVQSFYDKLVLGEVPVLALRTRTKNNIVNRNEYWVLGDKLSQKKADDTNGSLGILRLIHLIRTCRSLIEENKSSTLREIYYYFEGFKYAKYKNQRESDRLIEDLEVATFIPRDKLKIWPETRGFLYGPIVITEKTRKGSRTTDCQNNVGEAGFAIPCDPDSLIIESCSADFILAIETGGTYRKLVEERFDEAENCLLVNLNGFPVRSARRLMKNIVDKHKMPVYTFLDCDCHSFQIHASIVKGSIKTAHLSEYLAIPEAKHLGVRPEDIKIWDLPTDDLSPFDLATLEDEEIDPRFTTDPMLSRYIAELKTLKKKAEQQAFAIHGLSTVITYLKHRLSQIRNESNNESINN